MSSLSRSTNKPKTGFLIYYQCFLAVAAIFVFFSSLPGVLNAYGKGIPLLWVILFVLLAAPLYPSIFRKLSYFPKSIFIWFGLYLAMTCIAILAMPGTSIPLQQILEDQIRSIIFICLMMLIFSEYTIIHSYVRVSILLVTIFNVFLYLAQFLQPSILQEVQDVPGRSGGFYIDSNMASFALNTGLIFSISLIKPKYRLIYALFVLMGNAVTFSRGGMACWGLIVLLFMAFKVISPTQLPILIISILTTATIISSQINNLAYIKTPDGQDLFSEGTIERVKFLVNPFADGEEEIEEEGDESRLLLVELGWQKFTQSPWYGNGLGSGSIVGVKADLGSEPRTHNIYLDRAIEYGFLGALLYPLFVLAVIWKAQGKHRRYAIIFGMNLLIWGIFSHTVFTNFFILTCCSYVAILSHQSRIDCFLQEKQNIEY